MEIDVLRGSAQLIDACKPAIQIRSECGSTSRFTNEFLSEDERNYLCYWNVQKNFKNENYAHEENDIFDEADRFSTALFCLHQDDPRIAKIENLPLVDRENEKYLTEEYDFSNFGIKEKVMHRNCTLLKEVPDENDIDDNIVEK